MIDYLSANLNVYGLTWNVQVEFEQASKHHRHISREEKELDFAMADL